MFADEIESFPMSNNENNNNLDSENTRSSLNKSSIVMEMVEAVIDNNYDVNSPNSSQIESSEAKRTTTHDDENNFEASTSVRDPVNAQLSRKQAKSKLNRRKRIHSKGEQRKTIQQRFFQHLKAFNAHQLLINVVKTFQIQVKHFCRHPMKQFE